MSRGPGRLQRLLLHAVYHDPKIAPSGARYVYVHDYGHTESELSAVYRAARAIAAKGWVIKHSGSARIEPLPVPPAVVANCSLCVSVQNVPTSGLSERLTRTSVQVLSFSAPEQHSAVSVQNGEEFPHSEQLEPSGVQVGTSAEISRHLNDQPAVSVRPDPAKWITGLDGKNYPRTVERNRDHRIVLARSAGKPYRTIAAEIGCSVGTVHRVLSQWTAVDA